MELFENKENFFQGKDGFDPELEALADDLFKDIINQSTREKIRRLYKILAWKINAPVLDLDFGEEKYNSGLLLSCLTCLVNGKMLLFGPSGTGKSTMVECTAQLLFGDRKETLQAATIYGHSQITMDDLVKAVLPPQEEEGDKISARRDISQVSILFIDDLSGMGSAALTLLHTLLEEGVIIRHNIRHDLEIKPIFATSNRLTTSDYRSRALLDRFHIATVPTGMNPDWLGSLMRGLNPSKLPSRGFNIHEEDIKKVNRQIREIFIAPGILERLEYFLAELSHCARLSEDPRFTSKAGAYLESECAVEALCENCPLKEKNPNIICQHTALPLSTRALEALILYIRAVGWFLGKKVIDDPKIIEEILPFIFIHRLIPSRSSIVEGTAITRIPWLRQLWKNSQLSWDENNDIMDLYRHTMAILSDPDGLIRDKEIMVNQAMVALEKLNSTAKFAYMTALQARAHDSSVNICFSWNDKKNK